MEYQYQNMPFKIIVGMRRLQDFESFWSSDFQGILSIPAFADTIRKVWKALSINIQNIKRRREINKLSVLTASLLVVSKPDNRDDGHSHKWRGTRSPSPSWSQLSQVRCQPPPPSASPIYSLTTILPPTGEVEIMIKILIMIQYERKV